MDNQELLKFADKIKTKFFYRLKDETQPAKKEFSYIDLLGILYEVYAESNITKQDIEKYDKEKQEEALNELEPIFKETFGKAYVTKKKKWSLISAKKSINTKNPNRGINGNKKFAYGQK